MSKIGIIGFGKVGRIRAKSIEKYNGNIIGVYDTDINSDECEYTLYSDSTSLIDDSDIIFICTPNKYNYPLTLESLNKNKHVFCEKPPAFNAKQILEIRIAESKSSSKLMYGFNHRHHESITDMKNIIDNGDYGKILWMRGRYGKSVDENFFDGWRSNKELVGGGILLDQGIHMLDLLIYFGGYFDKVKSRVSNQYWKLDGIEDNVFAILENSSNGVVAQLHSTMTQWRHLFSLEIFLEEGYITLNGLKTSSGTYGEEELSVLRKNPNKTGEAISEVNKVYKVDKSWDYEVSHFLNSIVNKNSINYGTSNDALNVMTIIDNIYENGKD